MCSSVGLAWSTSNAIYEGCLTVPIDHSDHLSLLHCTFEPEGQLPLSSCFSAVMTLLCGSESYGSKLTSTPYTAWASFKIRLRETENVSECPRFSLSYFVKDTHAFVFVAFCVVFFFDQHFAFVMMWLPFHQAVWACM